MTKRIYDVILALLIRYMSPRMGLFVFNGVVAQFGRAPAWHAGGQGFNPPQLHFSYFFAKVAELVYALVSKTSGLTAVRVQLPPLALKNFIIE